MDFFTWKSARPVYNSVKMQPTDHISHSKLQPNSAPTQKTKNNPWWLAKLSLSHGTYVCNNTKNNFRCTIVARRYKTCMYWFVHNDCGSYIYELHLSIVKFCCALNANQKRKRGADVSRAFLCNAMTHNNHIRTLCRDREHVDAAFWSTRRIFSGLRSVCARPSLCMSRIQTNKMFNISAPEKKERDTTL